MTEEKARPGVCVQVCLLLCLALAVAEARAETLFRDATGEMGLDLPRGSAACWVDIDNDGWVDLVTGGVIWRNEEGRRFTRLADGFGSVVAADFDNDGYVDLFSWSQMRLYRNVEGHRFERVPLPELPPMRSRGAAWADFTGNGFVDLYVGGYENWNEGITYPDLLLANQGDGTFTLAWQNGRYRARGVSACDFNRSGAPDVYVSNYRLQPNRLWINEGAGKFRDAAADLNAVGTSRGFRGGHSIGAAWGDFDNDGHFDLFVGNFAHVDQRGDQPKSRFLRNRGPRAGYAFEDKGPCGVFYQESYASPAVGDFDNDGALDLYFTTVYASASFGRKNYPVLFRNEGRFRFSDVTAEAGLKELGPTYQAAWADVNNNGYLDLVSAGRLFLNRGGPNRWIKVRLEGDGRQVNRSAIGAQVRVRLGRDILTRQVEAGTGEGNQNDMTLHLGLGSHSAPVAIEIFWPEGSVQHVRGMETNRLHVVRFGAP